MLVKSDSAKAKICPFSLGVALGVAEGLFMLLFAWAGHFWHYGLALINLLATVYHGYAPTLPGGIYGGLWGLLDGFIFGFIVALIYNFCLCCCCAKSCDIQDMKNK